MKYSLHIGNNEDSRGSLEIIFYFLINILLTLKTKHLLIVIKTYFGAVVVKRCDVSTCYDRSWSRMSLSLTFDIYCIYDC